MKAKLIFDLENPDDTDSFKEATDAPKLASFIWDYWHEVIRAYYKYGVPDTIADKGQLLEDMRQKYIDLLDTHNIGKYV